MTTPKAIRMIDWLAEQTRLRYITPGVGQAQVYAEKAAQATDYIAAGCPGDLTNYPYIRVEANVTNFEPKEVAERIIDASSRWVKIGVEIERIRLQYKQVIKNTTDVNMIRKATDEAVEEFRKI